jgi:hypothetical protein
MTSSLGKRSRRPLGPVCYCGTSTRSLHNASPDAHDALGGVIQKYHNTASIYPVRLTRARDLRAGFSYI